MLVANTLPLAEELAVATGAKFTSKITFVPEAGVTGVHEAVSELKDESSRVPVTAPVVDKIG